MSSTQFIQENGNTDIAFSASILNVIFKATVTKNPISITKTLGQDLQIIIVA